MENIRKGTVVIVEMKMGKKEVVFSHYTDKWNKRFYDMNGVTYECIDVV